MIMLAFPTLALMAFAFDTRRACQNVSATQDGRAPFAMKVEETIHFSGRKSIALAVNECVGASDCPNEGLADGS